MFSALLEHGKLLFLRVPTSVGRIPFMFNGRIECKGISFTVMLNKKSCVPKLHQLERFTWDLSFFVLILCAALYRNQLPVHWKLIQRLSGPSPFLSATRDRPAATGPDLKRFERAAVYSANSCIWHKCEKRLKPENRKDPLTTLSELWPRIYAGESTFQKCKII